MYSKQQTVDCMFYNARAELKFERKTQKSFLVWSSSMALKSKNGFSDQVFFSLLIGNIVSDS
jgi:hypothetical protein